MTNTTIIIAESLDIYREGLYSIIRNKSSLNVIENVLTAKDLIQTYSLHPDSICLIASTISDMNIQDIMHKLSDINPSISAIVLAHSTDPSLLDMSIKTGVKGYFTKQSSSDELLKIITEVRKGNKAYSSNITELMIDKYREDINRTNAITTKITKREKEIIKFIVDGYTSSEIAKKLFISTRTVETHRANIMTKLKLKNTAALVRYAIQKGNIS